MQVSLLCDHDSKHRSTGNIRKSQQSRHPVHLTSQQTCFRLGNSISIKTTIMESISCGLDSWNGTSLTFNDFANLLKRNLLSRINSSINRLLTFKCPFNRPLINLVIHPLVAISCDNVVTNELIKFLSSIDPMSQIPLSLTNLSVVCMTTKILLIIRHKNTANWIWSVSLKIRFLDTQSTASPFPIRPILTHVTRTASLLLLRLLFMP